MIEPFLEAAGEIADDRDLGVGDFVGAPVQLAHGPCFDEVGAELPPEIGCLVVQQGERIVGSGQDGEPGSGHLGYDDLLTSRLDRLCRRGKAVHRKRKAKTPPSSVNSAAPVGAGTGMS